VKEQQVPRALVENLASIKIHIHTDMLKEIQQ